MKTRTKVIGGCSLLSAIVALFTYGAIQQWKWDDGVGGVPAKTYRVQMEVVVSASDIWMLDFDKGALKPPGPWQQETLSRLHRSLEKVVGLDPNIHFRTANWEQLLEGYFNASKSA